MIDPLFAEFEQKLIASGLIEPGAALMSVLDADIAWNQIDPACEQLTPLFSRLNINSLLYAVPAEPYRSIIDFLAASAAGAIHPQDCETRTFLHDIPIAATFDAEALAACLKTRKGAVITAHGVVAFGMVSLEQAFVTYSSICFACFVKFFHDYLRLVTQGRADARWRKAIAAVTARLDPPPQADQPLRRGPFQSEADIMAALDQAGALTVKKRLVDSYFGNISYRRDGILYISQTGSSLDALSGCIDPCPLDGSTCVAITASSELPAHLAVIAETGARAILHGHPRFAVILSMHCAVADCACPDDCHRKCPHDRRVCGTPIVSGEVGAGPYGLCRTIPRALKHHPAVIVYGHGVFAIGDTDFNAPFQTLLNVENACRDEYFALIQHPPPKR